MIKKISVIFAWVQYRAKKMGFIMVSPLKKITEEKAFEWRVDIILVDKGVEETPVNQENHMIQEMMFNLKDNLSPMCWLVIYFWDFERDTKVIWLAFFFFFSYNSFFRGKPYKRLYDWI